MRTLRLLCLAFAICAAYLAYHVIGNGNPIPALQEWPRWLRPLWTIPGIAELARLSSVTWVAVVLALAPVTLILYSTIVPEWPWRRQRVFLSQPSHTRQPATLPRLTQLWFGLAAVGFLAALGTSLLTTTTATGVNPSWLPGARAVQIAAGILAALAYLGALKRVERTRPSVNYLQKIDLPVRPYAFGIWLIPGSALLLAAWVWLIWPLPYSLDALTLTHLQQLRPIASVPTPHLIVPGGVLGGVLNLPSTILGLWTSDTIQVGIVRASAMALLCAGALWLLAGEFFRRVPRLGKYGEPIDDDGALATLLSIALFCALPGFLHLSRIPYALEPVTLGMAGLWLLMRGVRTDHLPTVGGGALLTGATFAYGSAGLTWLLLGGLAWLGIHLFQPAWLRGRWVTHPHTGAQPVCVQRGIGKVAIAYWLGGCLLTATIALVATGGVTFTGLDARWAWGFWMSTPPFQGVASVWPSEPATIWSPGANTSPLLHSLYQAVLISLQWLGQWTGFVLAPWAWLGLAALFVHLDRVFGWIIGGWLLITLAPLLWLNPGDPLWILHYAAALPALALLLALTFDRARVLILRDLGTWNLQASIYAMFGLIIAAASANLVNYVESSATQYHPIAALARVLPVLEPQTPLYFPAFTDLGTDLGTDLAADVPAVNLLVEAYGHSAHPLPNSPDHGIDASRLMPRAIIIAGTPDSIWHGSHGAPSAPSSAVSQTETITIIRDLRGNPVLYILQAPLPHATP